MDRERERERERERGEREREGGREGGERLRRETQTERREKELKIDKYGLHWPWTSSKNVGSY